MRLAGLSSLVFSLSSCASADGDNGSSGGGLQSDKGGVDTATDGESAPTWTMSSDEQELFDLVIAYRTEVGLGPIPYAPSLAYVARTHATDLRVNRPHEASEECNLHSWSDAGPWSACCYTDDHAEAECMWDKPAELTSYEEWAMEISYGSGGTVTPAEALAAWDGSEGHRAVIVNEGVWDEHPWRAMGVGIDGGFANIWFGETADPAAAR